eukprot:gene1925-1065_t
MRVLLSIFLILCLLFFASGYELESIRDLEEDVSGLDLEDEPEEENTLGKLEDEALSAIADAKKITEGKDESDEEEPTSLSTTNKTTAPAGAETTETKCDPNKAKSKTVTIILAIFLGGLGVDRFYIGNYVTGIVVICINILFGGLFGLVWPIVDLILILTGSVKDGNGCPLQ